jgi:hypothetical protein
MQIFRNYVDGDARKGEVLHVGLVHGHKAVKFPLTSVPFDRVKRRSLQVEQADEAHALAAHHGRRQHQSHIPHAHHICKCNFTFTMILFLIRLLMWSILVVYLFVGFYEPSNELFLIYMKHV